MLPLYATRIEDLGPGEFVNIEPAKSPAELMVSGLSAGGNRIRTFSPFAQGRTDPVEEKSLVCAICDESD